MLKWAKRGGGGCTPTAPGECISRVLQPGSECIASVGAAVTVKCNALLYWFSWGLAAFLRTGTLDQELKLHAGSELQWKLP